MTTEHRSDVEVSERCLIKVDQKVFAIKGLLQ